MKTLHSHDITVATKALNHALALALIVCLLAPSQSLAATFLNLAGIPGDSVDTDHVGQIDVAQYTQLVSGDRNCVRLVVVKRLDNASPALSTLAVTRQRISDGRVEKVTGPDRFVFFSADLAQIAVNSVELVNQSDGSVMEKVMLTPRALTLSFIPQRSDGTPGTPITGSVACK